MPNIYLGLIPFLSSNTWPPLERGNLVRRPATDMAILWIEKQVLLVEGIIPTGIMARSQVTFDMAHPLDREDLIVLLTWRSAGSGAVHVWKKPTLYPFEKSYRLS